MLQPCDTPACNRCAIRTVSTHSFTARLLQCVAAVACGPWIDYDGDGQNDEMDIGCEACHGKGSAHFASPGRGKSILLPNLLSAERADMVCGQCHTRGEGKGTLGGEHTEYPSAGTAGPLDMPYPGMSRAEFVTTFHEDALGTYADDRKHARQHHQQYNDYLKSAHNKNPYDLVSCGDCHDMHDRKNGPSLVASADDNTLCLNCHAPYTFALAPNWTRQQEALAVSEHMSDEAAMNVGYDPRNVTNVAVATTTGGVGQCTTCHMPKTAASQSRFMAATVDANKQPVGARIRGDVSSHQFDVITPAVSQSLFTGGGANNQLPNSCGQCHNAISGISPNYTW